MTTPSELEMRQIQAQDLQGAALDWCVCVALKDAVITNDYGRACLTIPGSCALLDGCQHHRYIPVPSYSSNENGLQRHMLDYKIGVFPRFDPVPGAEWTAELFAESKEVGPLAVGFGKTPLVAVCRAIVKHKLGNVVLIPTSVYTHSLTN